MSILKIIDGRNLLHNIFYFHNDAIQYYHDQIRDDKNFNLIWCKYTVV